ncbi:MAG: ABC transporter permease [Candidatus Rokuibacteriota bacterium]|jgi:NitT/TauT family transport system permease protein|nr:MAG: ABC transporter permease [Candidatus Rokubacteria bacterium]
MKERLAGAVLPVGVLVGTLVVWELVWRVFDIPRFVVPLPSGILVEGWQWRGYLAYHAWVTLYETLGGFALSIAVGTPIAVMLVYSATLKQALYPLLVVTQAIPKVAIAPVLLLLLGAGEVSKIVIAFLVAFFPIVVDTATGLAATPPELLDLSRSYRASAAKTFVKVRFPMALPFFFSGLKVAVTLAVIGAVVGEFVGSDKGLGYVIVSATSYWRSNLAFAAMLLLAAMAVGLFALVELCERLVCPWTTAAREQPEPTAE